MTAMMASRQRLRIRSLANSTRQKELATGQKDCLSLKPDQRAPS